MQKKVAADFRRSKSIEAWIILEISRLKQGEQINSKPHKTIRKILAKEFSGD